VKGVSASANNGGGYLANIALVSNIKQRQRSENQS